MTDDRSPDAGTPDPGESPSEAMLRHARDELEGYNPTPDAGDSASVDPYADDGPRAGRDIDRHLDDQLDALDHRLDRQLDALDEAASGDRSALESALAGIDQEPDRQTPPLEAPNRRVIRPDASSSDQIDISAPHHAPSANPVDGEAPTSSLSAVLFAAAIVVAIGVIVLVLIAAISGGGTAAAELRIGDCVEAPQQAQITSVDTVPCAEPHVFEVMGTVTLAGGPYPGDDAAFEEGLSACVELFPGYVGAGYQTSPWYVNTFTPSREGWESGDRSATCLVFQFDDDLEYADVTGSVRDGDA